MKKKKGSTLVMVLFLSTLFTMIAGVVITSVMSTTKANAAEEFYEDLLYGAEAGIETALMRIERGIFAREVPVSNVSTYSHVDDFKKFRVDVAIKKLTTTEYEVVSTAIDKNDSNRKRTVKAKVMEEEVTGGIGEGTNIYKYVLCAEKIDVRSLGDIDESVSKWSAEDKVNSEALEWINEGKHTPTRSLKDRIVQNPMSIPIFDESKVGTRKQEINISGFEANGSVLDVGLELFKLSAVTNSGVKRIDFVTTNNTAIKVFLVNAERLNFEIGGLSLNNTIIITSGDINIKNNGISMHPNLHLNASTMFGEELNFNLSSFSSDYRLIDNPLGVNNTNIDRMTLDDVKRLDDEIRKYAPNWRSQTRRARVVSYEY